MAKPKKQITKQAEPTKRIRYTYGQKATARKYYLMGLTVPEIAKLMDVPPRTVEKWQYTEKWTAIKEARPIKHRAHDLHKAGKTYTQIAEILNVSYTTVWRYLVAAKADECKTAI